MGLNYTHEGHTQTGATTSVSPHCIRATATDLPPSILHHLKAFIQWGLTNFLAFWDCCRQLWARFTRHLCFTAFAFPECFRDCINDEADINSPSECLDVKKHMCLYHDGHSLLGSYSSGYGAHVCILSLYSIPN